MWIFTFQWRGTLLFFTTWNVNCGHPQLNIFRYFYFKLCRNECYFWPPNLALMLRDLTLKRGFAVKTAILVFDSLFNVAKHIYAVTLLWVNRTHRKRKVHAVCLNGQQHPCFWTILNDILLQKQWNTRSLKLSSISSKAYLSNYIYRPSIPHYKHNSDVSRHHCPQKFLQN